MLDAIVPLLMATGQPYFSLVKICPTFFENEAILEVFHHQM
jgi:hypothetical protein